MTSVRRPVLLRYWGSHFKSPRQVKIWLGMLKPVVTAGWRCILVLERPPEDPTWLEEVLSFGIETHFLPRSRGHFDVNCVRKVYSLCRSLAADVIHCENIYTSPLLGAFLARVPVRLWTVNNMNVYVEECRSPTFREKIAPSTRTAAAVSSRVLAVSNAVKNDLLQMGIPGHKVLVQPNYRSAVPGGPYDRIQIRDELGYHASEVVVVTVGHAIPVKGWDLLLRAFQEISVTSPQARLLFVGSTGANHEQACFAELQTFIKSANLGSVVKFTDHIHDVARVLAAGDVFVLSSRSEAYSLALVEAMEMGLPCLAAKVGIAQEVIHEGINGFLVERNNWRKLAEQLQKLISDAELRENFRRASRVPAFIPTVPEYGNQLFQLYNSLLPTSVSSGKPQ